MREIKFRVWDKQKGCFIDDPKDYRPDEHYGKGELLLDLDGNVRFAEYPQGNGDNSADSVFVNFGCNRFVIQQFTGLKDTDGKEIYEGDLIKISIEKGSYGGNYILRDNEKENILSVNWGNYDDGEYVSRIECWMLGSDSLSELIDRSRYEKEWIRTYKIIGNVLENNNLIK